MPQALIIGKEGQDLHKLEKIQYCVQDGAAVIHMNCPGNLNAIDERMAEELDLALAFAEENPKAGIVVLKGLERAFSAGGDIRFFYDQIQAGGEVDMDGLIGRVGAVADRMKKMGKLIIAAVSGVAAGAGVSLALGADFILCTEETRFILAFVNLGLVPDTGAAYLLSRSIGAARALELAVTGRPVGAAEAKQLGLVYKVVPAGDLDQAVMDLASRLAKGPLVSYANIKKQIYDASFADYRKWLDETEVPTQHECSNTVYFREGVRAFMEKRRPVFTGK